MSQKTELKPLVLNPDAGRVYPMGRMPAVFKADLEETDSTLSVSEWWLEPNTVGDFMRLVYNAMEFDE